MVSKDEVVASVETCLGNLDDSDLETLTKGSLKERLVSDGTLSEEDVAEHSKVIKETMMTWMAAKMTAGDDAGDDEEEEDEDEEAEEDEGDDGDMHPAVAAMDDEWKSTYETIVWAKGKAKFPWWPSYVLNPSFVADKFKERAIKNLGKQHMVCYLGPQTAYDFVSVSNIQSYEAHKADHAEGQKMSMAYTRAFPKAMAEAQELQDMEEEDRREWGRPKIKKERKKKTAKAAAGGSKGKGKGKGSEKDKAPRALSSYMLFSTEMRAAVKEEMPDAPITEIAKELGARWKAMSNEEKEEYKQRAAAMGPAGGKGKKPTKASASSSSSSTKKKAPAKKKTASKVSSSPVKNTGALKGARKTREELFGLGPAEDDDKDEDKEQDGDADDANDDDAENDKDNDDGDDNDDDDDDDDYEAAFEEAKKAAAEEKARAKSAPRPKAAKKAPPKPPPKPTMSAAEKQAKIAQETRPQRAQRLTKLLEFHTKDVNKVKATLAKIDTMDLSLNELKESGAAIAVNACKKHFDESVRGAANALRNKWKAKYKPPTAGAPPPAPVPAPAQAPPAPPAPASGGEKRKRDEDGENANGTDAEVPVKKAATSMGEDALNESEVPAGVSGNPKRFRALQVLHKTFRDTATAVRIEAAAASSFEVDSTDYMNHTNRVAFALKGMDEACGKLVKTAPGLPSLESIVEAKTKDEIRALIK